ncbi:MAG: cupin domain-containing protein [Acidobacteriota bacterium]
MSDRPTVIDAARIDAMEEVRFRHPLNPKSGATFRSLSETAGLERIGFHLIRLGPGREANELHTHRFEEEFYYVLSGRGVLLAGDEEHEMGPGSFVGFPTPSEPHLMTNPFDEDLVYLVGGERNAFEIAEFPRHGKVMIRDGTEVLMVDREHVERPSFAVDEADES